MVIVIHWLRQRGRLLFHVERALFLADSFGLDAVAFAAAEVVGPKSWPVQARELLARSKMMLDILIGVGPRHLGPPVALPSPLEISR